MYYLNSRYYNPEIGRFINADGLIGQTGDILGHNMYAYAKNNPIMMVDSSGYMPTWMKVAFGVVAVAAVVTAAIILAPAVVATISTLVVSGSGVAALGAGGAAITAGGAATAIGAMGLAYLSASIAATDGAVIDDAISTTKSCSGSPNPQCGPDKELFKQLVESSANISFGNGPNGLSNINPNPNSYHSSYANSFVDFQSGSQRTRRFFDSQGKAIFDIDYAHGNPHNHKFPHYHYWDWCKGNPSRENFNF